jgi:5'-3' exonuclease
VQIIDAGMLAFSAWHVLKKRVSWPLTFQVPRMLRALVAEARDTYVLCWNAERMRKDELWPAYRDRKEIWEEAGRKDFDAMFRVLSALGVVQYRADGWEADEEIAAVVHQIRPSGERITIRSDDKDFFQLLSGSTWMEGRRRGRVRYSDVKGIFGVTPVYAADFQALVGDPVDGIPRIVSDATARQLLASRGHVRDWIDKDLRVGPGVKRKLEEGREQLRINLELVDLSEAAVGPPPEPALEGWADLEVARRIGERLEITYLAADTLAQEYRVLREWGERTRERLGV